MNGAHPPHRSPRARPPGWHGKRAFDVAAALCALAVSSPVWIAVALAIFLDDRGPVLYGGRRVGRDGRMFTMWKFRTMVPDAEAIGGSSTSDHDPRLTRVGRHLRRWKIDELPQLLNVLVGSMSIVGPRPQVAWDVERYTADERRILTVRPGITDWASIRFSNEGEILAGGSDPDEAYDRLIRPGKIALELGYVDTVSFPNDMAIIARTASTLLGRRKVSPPGNNAMKGAHVATTPVSTIFETYVFGNAYGNLRYLEGLLRADSERRLRVISPAAVLPPGLATSDSVQVVAGPRRLQIFGGRALAPRNAVLLAPSLLLYNVKLARALRRAGTTVVQFNNIRSFLAGVVAARLARARIIWYVKGHLDNPRLDRLGFRLADRVLFQNEVNRDRCRPDLVRSHGEKIRIVPNGIDTVELDRDVSQGARAAVRAELDGALDSGAVNIGYIGQVSPLKGMDDLLEAMALVQDRAQVALWVVGDAGAPEYETFAADFASRARSVLRDVHFLGYRSDARAILSLMDVFVMPSLSEGVPRSLLEAMALGVPPVTTDVGGIPGVVASGVTGLVVPAGEPGRLADALCALCDDGAARTAMAAAARSEVRGRYSIEANLEALLDVHDELVGGARRA